MQIGVKTSIEALKSLGIVSNGLSKNKGNME